MAAKKKASGGGVAARVELDKRVGRAVTKLPPEQQNKVVAAAGKAPSFSALPPAIKKIITSTEGK